MYSLFRLRIAGRAISWIEITFIILNASTSNSLKSIVGDVIFSRGVHGGAAQQRQVFIRDRHVWLLASVLVKSDEYFVFAMHQRCASFFSLFTLWKTSVHITNIKTTTAIERNRMVNQGQRKEVIEMKS